MGLEPKMKEILLVELWENRLADIINLVEQRELEYAVARPFNVEDIPNGQYSGIILSGGRPCISEIDKDPFLYKVIEFTKDQVEKGTPILGICLGHQVLASSIGGLVKRMDSEVGFCEVYHSNSELLKDIANPLLAFQYHQDTVVSLPSNTKVFASSEKYHIQGFRVKNKPCWGVQFHPEISKKRSKEIFNQYRKPMEEKGVNVDEMIRLSDSNYDDQECFKVVNNFFDKLC